MRKLIKKYIRGLIFEILDEETVKPSFAKLKRFNVDKNAKTPFNVMLHFDVTEYEFEIEYIDPQSSAKQKFTITTSDIAEFRTELKSFEIKYPHFKSCSFMVRYNHQMGSQIAIDFFTRGFTSAIYESSELLKITNTLVEFIDSHPELLV